MRAESRMNGVILGQTMNGPIHKAVALAKRAAEVFHRIATRAEKASARDVHEVLKKIGIGTGQQVVLAVTGAAYLNLFPFYFIQALGSVWLLPTAGYSTLSVMAKAAGSGWKMLRRQQDGGPAGASR